MRLPPVPPNPLGSQPLREQLDVVDRLAAPERVAAMYRGELSLVQLCRWASREPGEIAVIDGEFVFIAVGLPELAEASSNGDWVPLPELVLAA